MERWRGGVVEQFHVEAEAKRGEGAMKEARCNIASFLSESLKGEQRKSV